MSELDTYGKDLQKLHGLYPGLLTIDFNVISEKYEIHFQDDEISVEDLVFIGLVERDIYWFAVEGGGRFILELDGFIQRGTITLQGGKKNRISDKCCSKLHQMNIIINWGNVLESDENRYDMAAIHRRYVLNNIINE